MHGLEINTDWSVDPVKENSTSFAFRILKLKVARCGKLAKALTVRATTSKSSFAVQALHCRVYSHSQSNYWPITCYRDEKKDFLDSHEQTVNDQCCRFGCEAEEDNHVQLKCPSWAFSNTRNQQHRKQNGLKHWNIRAWTLGWKVKTYWWSMDHWVRSSQNSAFVNNHTSIRWYKKKDWLTGWRTSTRAVAGCCCSRRAANGPV